MSDMFNEFEDLDFSDNKSGNSKDAPPVEIAGALCHNTDKAILLSDGEKDIWVPKSQITGQNLNQDGHGTIMVKEWFAKKEGLI